MHAVFRLPSETIYHQSIKSGQKLDSTSKYRVHKNFVFVSFIAGSLVQTIIRDVVFEAQIFDKKN